MLAISLSCGGAREALPQEPESLVEEEDGGSATTPRDSSQELGAQRPRDVPREALEVEIQRHINELRREQLEDRGNVLEGWLVVVGLVLTFFGIVIAVAGFFSFGRFREIEADARAGAEGAKTNAEAAKARLEEAAEVLTKIENLRRSAEAESAAITRLHETTAEDAETAPDQATKAIEGVASNPEASPVDRAIARAFTLQREGKNQEAIQRWRAIAVVSEGQNDDLAARAWFSSGYLHGDIDPGEAVADYDKAIALQPDYAAAYINRGIANHELGRPDEALADYDEAIALRPDYAAAYRNRGVAKLRLERQEQAEADFDKAIALQPDDAAAYFSRGFAKRGLGRREEAVADYDKAIALQPDDAAAYNNRGFANHELGRHDEALADYDKAIALQPDDAAAYFNRGVTKRGLGCREEAVADFDKAIALQPDLVNAHVGRGVAKLGLGRREEAVADYDKAIALQPDYAEAYFNRGVAIHELGRPDEALADFAKAIELDPGFESLVSAFQEAR